MEEDNAIISLDIVSLFTNIPINLINDSIVKRWDYISGNTAIPMNEILTAINMIVDSTYFTFNKNYYKQIFGTPMLIVIAHFSRYSVTRLGEGCSWLLTCRPPILF